jgi:hypothetical protein
MVDTGQMMRFAVALGAVGAVAAAVPSPGGGIQKKMDGDTACDGGCAAGPFKATTNMNGDYTIALGGNGGGTSPPAGFSTVSGDYDKGNVEYFDMYSPLIKSRYSQVYWTMMKSVPLPPALMERFTGRTMAITGWESDQVIKGEAGQPDTSVPITWAYNHHYGSYINGKDSVLEQVELQGDKDPNGFMGHAFKGDQVWTTRPKDDDSNATSRIPASTVFATGNGGEYRKSFHSYATGYAQLVESPVSWAIQPMQIDTWNRDGSMAEPGMPFKPSIYPASISAKGGSHAPRTGPDAAYSGVLECPCSDRITRVLGSSAGGSCTTKVDGSCSTASAVMTSAECDVASAKLAREVAAPAKATNGSAAKCTSWGEKPGMFLAGIAAGAPASFPTLAAAQAWCCAHSAHCGGITHQPDPKSGIATYTARSSSTPQPFSMKGLSSWLRGGASAVKFSFASGANSSLPTGCSMAVDPRTGIVSGFYNTDASSAAPCGGQPGARKVSGASVVGEVTMSLALDEAKNQATITLSGPAAVWFGVGLDATGMSTQPYAIVVSGGTGVVSEHKLGVHAPGTILQPTVKVVSSNVVAGRRTVVLTRALKIADYEGDHFDFDATRTSLPLIAAVGSGPAYAYHKTHYLGTLAMFAEAAPTCVCGGAPAAFGDTANGVLLYNASGTGGADGSVGFGKHCLGECPASNPDCSESSTILTQKNPTCDVRAYRGGLGCCHHLYFLTDKNQSDLIPQQLLQYHMKLRFYFQEYEPAKHQQLYRWHWQVATGAGEYDVPQCAPGTPVEKCLHTIKAKVQVKDF